MDKNIKKILDDLYAIDSDLKKHEKELIDIIKKLIASKPNIKFDENFKIKLRAELLEKFSQIDNKKINFNFMNKLTYAFGALVVLLLVLVPTFFKKPTQTANNKLTTNINFGLEMDQLGRNAFGKLASNDAIAPENTAVPAGMGGGGGIASSMPVDAKMIMPYEPVVYKYVYEGDDFSVEGDQMAVLKKIKGLGSQADAAKILQNLNFDNINLSSLNNTKLRNFTIYEDKDYGYSANVDLYEGMISINEHWERWPIYREPIRDSIGINDVPSDDKLISMANKFLQDRNVSTEGYGDPVVDNSWRQNYLRFENKADFMIPDVATVIYPSIIDGKEVYEEWGNVQGLRVSINLRYNKVNGMWNLTSNKYQSSLYDMETDVEKILDLASKGGYYYSMPEQTDAKVVEIKLGTPHIVYMQTWQFADNISSQILVPALAFPITNIPDEAEYYYRENILVPLAKDIITQRMIVY